jgi:putative transcriptional regulator
MRSHARRDIIALFFAAAIVGSSAPLLHAALQSPVQGHERTSLAGRVLVAAPGMRDPRFYHSVVLMVQHDANGALGIVINRPLGERTIAEVLEATGIKEPGMSGRVRIFLGGPVQPEIGFILHTAEYRRAKTIDIDGHVAMTSDREVLRDIGLGQGPKKSLVAFGYAGWAPGQLEGELRQQAWFTASQDEKLVFDEDRDKVWDIAMTRRTQDL